MSDLPDVVWVHPNDDQVGWYSFQPTNSFYPCIPLSALEAWCMEEAYIDNEDGEYVLVSEMLAYFRAAAGQEVKDE